MGSISAWLRRLQQLPLLFRPPENLRRNDVRLLICTPVSIHAGGRRVVCKSINISSTGILVDRALPVKPGAPVELSAPGFVREIPGRVIRVGAHSTAIRFESAALGLTFLGWASGQEATQRRDAATRIAAQ